MTVLAGCNDSVSTHFDSLQEARDSRAFERGWLPPILPESAKNISERNDLDLNTGTGSFDYELTERPAYVQSLIGKFGAGWKEGSTHVIILRSDKSGWELNLPVGKGTGHWKVQPEKASLGKK